MDFLHRWFARLHSPLPLCQLPAPLSQIPGLCLDDRSKAEANADLGCNEVVATWEDDQVTLFMRDELIIGMRFDLRRSYAFLKVLLTRSVKAQGKDPLQEAVDRAPMYIAKLAGNMVTISGYTGSIGVWTADLWNRMRAPKKDPIEDAYKGTKGYAWNWKIRDDDAIGSGVIEVYIKHGTTETLLGKSALLDSFALELVLFVLGDSGLMKLLKNGTEIGEIPLAAFSLPKEEGWQTQGAVYKSGDLYVLWHTSIVDFKNALGYKLVK